MSRSRRSWAATTGRRSRTWRLRARWRRSLKSADVPFDEAALFKAVELAKTDLTTELVKEFTELQGVIGGLYARAQGLDERCAGDL